MPTRSRLALLVSLFVTVALHAAIPQTVIVPSGTSVHFKLLKSINTATAKAGQTVGAELTQPLVADGRTIARDGARATVRINEVQASGRVGGSATLSFSLVSIELANGTRADVHTHSYSREGKAHVKHNAAYIGGAAVAGAVIGQAVGHDHNSTARGAAIGAGVGLGAAAATGKFDFEVKSGERFTLKLKSQLKTTL